MNKTAKSGGEACVQLADGTYSADALHEQMTAGIDDFDIRAKTRAALRAKRGSGSSAEQRVSQSTAAGRRMMGIQTRRPAVPPGR